MDVNAATLDKLSFSRILEALADRAATVLAAPRDDPPEHDPEALFDHILDVIELLLGE